jgi:hypothetical protein
LADFPDVPINDTSILVFWSIVHTKGHRTTIHLDEPGLAEHVKFDYIQHETDWNSPQDPDTVPYRKYAMRECMKSDFCIHGPDKCDGTILEEFYDLWEDFSPLCPDRSVAEGGGLMQGDLADMKSKSVILQMRKCTNHTL